jgi:hypothetical protein
MYCPRFLNTPGPVPCVRPRFDRWCVRRYNPAIRSPLIPSCVILLRGRASSLPDPPNPWEVSGLAWRSRQEFICHRPTTAKKGIPRTHCFFVFCSDLFSAVHFLLSHAIVSDARAGPNRIARLRNSVMLTTTMLPQRTLASWRQFILVKSADGRECL